VVLFRVGIETVSEYQQELLRAVAVDTRSEESLPKLAETFLDTTAVETETASGGAVQLTKTDVRPLLETARDLLLESVQGRLDDIHREASRAADAEVEEYRQMQQQRIQELQEAHSNLSSKINDLVRISTPETRIHASKRCENGKNSNRSTRNLTRRSTNYGSAVTVGSPIDNEKFESGTHSTCRSHRLL